MLGWLFPGRKKRSPQPMESVSRPEPAKTDDFPAFQPVDRTAAFHNTIKQVAARYRFEIDHATYSKWQGLIDEGSDEILNLGRRENGSQLFVVCHKGTDIFLLCRDGRIATAVENVGGRYNSLVRQRRSAHEKTMRSQLPPGATLADVQRVLNERLVVRWEKTPTILRLLLRRRKRSSRKLT